MTTITLTHGYFIESDKRGYFLKQKYKGKSKNGEEKEYIKRLGYYNNLRSAVENFLKLIQDEYTDGMEVDLNQYAMCIENANRNAVWAIIKTCGGMNDERN